MDVAIRSYSPTVLLADLGLQSMASAYCTRDGMAFIPYGSSFSKIIDGDTRVKQSSVPAELDGRIEANKARTGQTLERNGKHIRIKTIGHRIEQWVKIIGGAKNVKLFTVTFPAGTTETVAKKVLNIALTRWRKAIPDLSYLWVIEPTKKMTPHYHILSDRWIDIQTLNGWVKASLHNLGDQVPWSSDEVRDNYNGVQVGSKDGQKVKFYSSNGVEKYLIKYLTKTDLTGYSQPWHCSRNIGRLAIKVRLNPFSAAKALIANLVASNRDFSAVSVFVGDCFAYIKWPSRKNEQISAILHAHNNKRWRHLHKPLPSPSPAPIVIAHQESKSVSSRASVGSQTSILSALDIPMRLVSGVGMRCTRKV